MNSDKKDALELVLEELRKRYADSSQFVCDFCGDDSPQAAFVNSEKGSAICWKCVSQMHREMTKLSWVNSTKWDEQSRH